MEVNGTLINYYVHCKGQCYLHGNRLNLEDNSETVKIGKAMHEEKNTADNTELPIENIKIDKLTKYYLTEVKKSDADKEAARWQLLYYLHVLKSKGIIRKGRLEFCEKNKSERSTEIVELDERTEDDLLAMIEEVERLIQSEEVPGKINKPTCKKCAYYEYCYI